MFHYYTITHLCSPAHNELLHQSNVLIAHRLVVVEWAHDESIDDDRPLAARQPNHVARETAMHRVEANKYFLFFVSDTIFENTRFDLITLTTFCVSMLCFSQNVMFQGSRLNNQLKKCREPSPRLHLDPLAVQEGLLLEESGHIHTCHGDILEGGRPVG